MAHAQDRHGIGDLLGPNLGQPGSDGIGVVVVVDLTLGPIGGRQDHRGPSVRGGLGKQAPGLDDLVVGMGVK